MKKIMQWAGLALVLIGLLYVIVLQRGGAEFAVLTRPAVFALLLCSGAGALLFGELLGKLESSEKRINNLEEEIRRMKSGKDASDDGVFASRDDADKNQSNSSR